MTVRFTGEAVADLDEIAEWIARDDMASADNFVDALVVKCLILSESSSHYPIVRSLRDRSIRKLTYRGYLVFYESTKTDILVLRILHGSRNWMRLFEEE